MKKKIGIVGFLICAVTLAVTVVRQDLRITDSGKVKYLGFHVPSLSGSTTFTLPDGDGTTGQVPTTDGAGTISWTSVVGSGIPSTRIPFSDGSGLQSSDGLTWDDTGKTQVITAASSDAKTVKEIAGSPSSIIRHEFYNAASPSKSFEFAADFTSDALAVQSDTHSILDWYRDGTFLFYGAGAIRGVLTLGTVGNTTAITGSTNTLSFGADLYPNGTSVAAISGSGFAGARTLNIKTAGSSTKFPIVVSQQPSSHGLLIIRGVIAASGTTPTSGEGFLITHTNSTGLYTLSFTASSFADTPSCTCTTIDGINVQCAGVTGQLSSSSWQVATALLSAGSFSLADHPFSFQCIGQRGS
jgi:hypothetical protein